VAFEVLGDDANVNGSFPLTPALSPRERENVRILLENSWIADFESTSGSPSGAMRMAIEQGCAGTKIPRRGPSKFVPRAASSNAVELSPSPRGRGQG